MKPTPCFKLFYKTLLYSPEYISITEKTAAANTPIDNDSPTVILLEGIKKQARPIISPSQIYLKTFQKVNDKLF